MLKITGVYLPALKEWWKNQQKKMRDDPEYLPIKNVKRSNNE